MSHYLEIGWLIWRFIIFFWSRFSVPFHGSTDRLRPRRNACSWIWSSGPTCSGPWIPIPLICNFISYVNTHFRNSEYFLKNLWIKKNVFWYLSERRNDSNYQFDQSNSSNFRLRVSPTNFFKYPINRVSFDFLIFDF